MTDSIAEISTHAPTIDKNEYISRALDLMDKHKTRRLLVLREGEVYGVLTLRGIMRTLGRRRTSIISPSSLHVTSAVTDNYIINSGGMSVEEAKKHLSAGKEVIIHKEGDDWKWVEPKNLLEYYNVRKIEGSANEVMIESYPVHPKDRLIHARRLMIERDVGRLPVLDEGELVGIITEYDVANAMRAFRELVPTNYQENRIRMILVEDVMSKNVIYFELSTPLEEVVKTLLERDIGGAPVLNAIGDVVGMLNRRTILRRLVDDRERYKLS
ncbi:CBS domain-containing protein [Methanosarcinales archaeon]|nr:MAG: CBS domain-containing protein [Methanosarcinales archaeon]